MRAERGGGAGQVGGVEGMERRGGGEREGAGAESGTEAERESARACTKQGPGPLDNPSSLPLHSTFNPQPSTLCPQSPSLARSITRHKPPP